MSPLAPSAAVEVLCEGADTMTAMLAHSTVRLRGAREGLASGWTGRGADGTLAELDRLLAERSAVVRALCDYVNGARQLIPSLRAAEQAHGLVCALTALNTVATVAAIASLGLDPVADAVAVASSAGVEAAISAGRAEVVAWVRAQLQREVLRETLAGVGRRTVVNYAASSAFSIASDGAFDVVTGRGDRPAGLPGLSGALGWALVGRRGASPEVPSSVGGLGIGTHLRERHVARTNAWLIDRLRGVALPGRPPRLVSSFASPADAARALAVVEGHLPQVLAALAAAPGRRVRFTLPLPGDVRVRAWRTANGTPQRIPRAELTSIVVVASTRTGDDGIVTVFVAHVRPGLPA